MITDALDDVSRGARAQMSRAVLTLGEFALGSLGSQDLHTRNLFFVSFREAN